MRVSERGMTLPGVMMSIVALLGLGLLGLRSTTRELRWSGQLVARERAKAAARSALELAAARLRALPAAQRDARLAGSRPQGPACSDPCRDCVPQGAEVVVPLRVAWPSCRAEPCVRAGAVAVLLDRHGSTTAWCDVPLRELVPAGDVDARVSVWLRNDAAEGLADAEGPSGGPSGGWSHDHDGRVVITATAEVRGTTIVTHEEVQL